jgi:hypothetical protein
MVDGVSGKGGCHRATQEGRQSGEQQLGEAGRGEEAAQAQTEREAGVCGQEERGGGCLRCACKSSSIFSPFPFGPFD